MAENAVRQTEASIKALKGLEAVRKRPGMYVGGTDIRALHHLVYEVVDNAIDEALAGRCDAITISLNEDGSVSVADNGGGIPVGIHPEEKISTLQMVLTMLHAGGKFDSGAYKVSGGLHGVGVSAVNALSEWMVAEVWRDGKVHRQEYQIGVPTTEVFVEREMEADEVTGTRITFLPDRTIMEETDFNFNTLAQRFREMAFVTRGVKISLVDHRVKPFPHEMTFYFEGGVRSFVRYLNRNRDRLHDPVYAEREVVVESENGNGHGHPPLTIGVELAFQYTDSSTTTELYFANTIHTPDGGSHQAGLRAAITRTINNHARKIGLLKDKDPNFSSNDTLEGLTAIVSVKHPDPQFESQTKVKLMNPDVQGVVSQVASDAFQEYLEVNAREARRIIEQCMTSMRARDAAKKARDLVRRGANLLENTTLPGKLADCSEQDPSRSELYIVEGDSAGGCFSGDTQIALTDGRMLSFRELVAEQAEGKTHFCYTIRQDGTLGIEQVLNARITKHNAEVIRLTLDNGETIVCTPDHRFMLRDGSYKAAIELTTDDSLMPYTIPETAATYNHRMVAVAELKERMDVYDIEVPHSHNFALASGVFVHNSAKQGRDRHFQAILPLRGKILNTERARLNKILDNNEVKALISALGVGIGDDFNPEGLRYGRIIIMSVAGDEPTLVMDKEGQVEFVKIGEFIDQCLAKQRNGADYQVMTFDLKMHETRFRPLKAVIRHGHEEAMYHLTTRYNRSVKVTSSHSVFVLEDGQVRLKKGNDVRAGDVLVASRHLPRPAQSPVRIDLLKTLFDAGLTEALYLKGEGIRQIAGQRVLDKVARPELWNEPRVSLSADDWKPLIAQRQAAGLSQQAVASTVGVKQPITISHWERGINRPIRSQFEGYLQAIGWETMVPYELIPSRIEERLAQDDSSKNARWREVSNYKPFGDFTAYELDQLGPDVEIVPQAHSEKAFGRFLPVDRDLLWFLGWYVAEGTLSAHQVSLNLGTKDEPFIAELSQAIEKIFREKPRQYHDPDSQGIKLYFHSVAAARLLRAWGLDRHANEKKLPDLVFSVAEDLQLAFLEGYFLGDGTTAGQNLMATTNSPEVKDGLLYLLGQLGVVATHSLHQPSTAADAPIQTRYPYYTITICGKAQMDTCRPIWERHHNAARVEEHLARPARKALDFVPISDDLIGLEVISAEEIEPVGQYVYDFSVEEDENFICGVGGLCAHNTDADVDGAHIRTLLLTFFFRYMVPLISNGHLYIAQPPLYLVAAGKKSQYAYTEDDRDRIIAEFGNPERINIQRYKGLGEMNPDQLWETTMNPANRTLLQVTIEDAAEADRVFDMLMGSAVPPRRRFITTHAKKATLDI